MTFLIHHFPSLPMKHVSLFLLLLLLGLVPGRAQTLTARGEATALALSPLGRMSLAATVLSLAVSRDQGRTWAETARPG